MPTYTALKWYFSNIISSIFSRFTAGFIGGSVSTMRFVDVSTHSFLLNV